MLFFFGMGISIAFAQNIDKHRAEIDQQYRQALQKSITAGENHKMTVTFANEDVNFGLIEKKLVFYYDNTQEEVNSNRLYLVRVERKEPKASIQETTDYLFDPAYPLGRFILVNRDFSSSVYRIEEKVYVDGMKPFLRQSKQTELATGKVLSDETLTKNLNDNSASKQGKRLFQLFNTVANPDAD